MREVVYGDGSFAQDACHDCHWHPEDEGRPLQSASFSEDAITTYYAEEDPDGGGPIGYRIEFATLEGQVSVFPRRGASARARGARDSLGLASAVRRRNLHLSAQMVSV